MKMWRRIDVRFAEATVESRGINGASSSEGVRRRALFTNMGKKPSDLWHCDACGRDFANRNQSHACARHDLEHHFRGKRPEIRALFDQVVAVIQAIGPVRILPEKTRVAFQVRMSFAQVTPRTNWLDGHVVLARRLEHPRFRQVQTFSPRNHLHVFRLTCPADIDDDFRAWMAEAYEVGEQRHLETDRRTRK